MVSAWSTANGIVLGQEKTADKSNEITAIPQLLEMLALKGCIVTIDAKDCRTELAKQIRKKKADYVLALKGNQGNLYSDAKFFFEASQKSQVKNLEMDYYEEVDSAHGRIENRECWVVEPNKYPSWFSTTKQWQDLNCIVIVKTRRELQDKTTEDTRFYITSCDSDAQTMLSIVRQHWQVENALHWTLDMTFREDESRIRKEASAENYAIVRHMALNLVKKESTVKASVKRKRAMAALCDDFRTKLIQQALCA